jgi:hypothetical protein
VSEHPILFSGAMVRAILAGTKTQTRRLVQAQGRLRNGVDDLGKPGIEYLNEWGSWQPWVQNAKTLRCPYGVTGDRLWVREAWAPADVMYGEEKDTPQTIAYLADRSAVVFDGNLRPHAVPGYDVAQWNWDSLRGRPSIHMPRWASRITLEIIDVRIERLQSISEKDAGAEGMGDPPFGTRIESFETLWGAINAKRAPWSSNPWVWVVAFRLADGAHGCDTCDVQTPAKEPAQ